MSVQSHLDFERRRKQAMERERAIRPKGWTSNLRQEGESKKHAQKIKDERDTELLKVRTVSNQMKLMWEDHLNEPNPNLYLVFRPEVEIPDVIIDGPFTGPTAVQKYVDMNERKLATKILTILNARPSLTQTQYELSIKVQELLVDDAE